MFVFGLMEKNMKANGKITKSMELESLLGLMEDLMKEIIEMIKNMVTGLILGQMVVSILDNGKMINGMEGEHMS